MTIRATITPGLFLGPFADSVWLDDLKPVYSPEEAVETLNSGKSALIVDGSWEDAERTLELLGVPEDKRQATIRLAQTGRLDR